MFGLQMNSCRGIVCNVLHSPEFSRKLNRREAKRRQIVRVDRMHTPSVDIVPSKVEEHIVHQ